MRNNYQRFIKPEQKMLDIVLGQLFGTIFSFLVSFFEHHKQMDVLLKTLINIE